MVSYSDYSERLTREVLLPLVFQTLQLTAQVNAVQRIIEQQFY